MQTRLQTEKPLLPFHYISFKKRGKNTTFLEQNSKNNKKTQLLINLNRLIQEGIEVVSSSEIVECPT